MKAMQSQILEGLYNMEITGRKPQLIVIHPADFKRLNIEMFRTPMNPPFKYQGIELIRSEDIKVGEVRVV